MKKLILVIIFIFGYTQLASPLPEISTIVIDSAPKKLYTELYSDENGGVERRWREVFPRNGMML